MGPALALHGDRSVNDATQSVWLKRGQVAATVLCITSCAVPLPTEEGDGPRAAKGDHGHGDFEGATWGTQRELDPCGSWSLEEDFSSQDFAVHSHGLRIGAQGAIDVTVERLSGRWQPRVVVYSNEGLLPRDRGETVPGEAADDEGADSFAVTLWDEGADRSSLQLAPRDARVTLLELNIVGAPPHDESAPEGGADGEEEPTGPGLHDGVMPPPDARYRVTVTQRCHADTPWFLWNTYYYLSYETSHDGDTMTLRDPTCAAIAEVPRAFYEEACVQGSGLLEDGSMVQVDGSCDCAPSCPTGGRLCFHHYEEPPAPFSRGARGTPMVPLRSIAVDRELISLGTPVYIEELDGVEIPRVNGLGGFVHDGCFRADDVGGAIRGVHIDVFTGHDQMHLALERLLPTRSQLTATIDAAKCQRLAPEPP
jgi:3D (Asp-Asp-Asp) domain-containing protein